MSFAAIASQSAWGLVGATLYLATPLLDMFGHGFGALMAPLAVGNCVAFDNPRHR